MGELYAWPSSTASSPGLTNSRSHAPVIAASDGYPKCSFALIIAKHCDFQQASRPLFRSPPIAKQQNTFAKRQREQEKRRKADDKRAKRDVRKNSPPVEPPPYIPETDDIKIP